MPSSSMVRMMGDGCTHCVIGGVGDVENEWIDARELGRMMCVEVPTVKPVQVSDGPARWNSAYRVTAVSDVLLNPDLVEAIYEDDWEDREQACRAWAREKAREEAA